MHNSDSELLKAVQKIASAQGLTAEFLGDENVKSVGVGGDHRTFTRIIVLGGPFPGHEKLAEVSTKISNLTGINRVTYDLSVPPAKGAKE